MYKPSSQKTVHDNYNKYAIDLASTRRNAPLPSCCRELVLSLPGVKSHIFRLGPDANEYSLVDNICV